MKKIFISLLTILMVVSICSCTSNHNTDDEIIENSNNNIDDEIINISNFILEGWELEEGRTFSVVQSEKDIYYVDINGYELLVQIDEDCNSENAKSNINECDSEVLDIVKASKDKVINYINDSKILKDKEELIEYINNIPVRMADLANGEATEYDYESDSIFINNEHRSGVCEWMIVHELVNALCQRTNGGVENERYLNTLFNDVFTDIITAGIQPQSINDKSQYFEYYHYIYLYLGCVGVNGIQSYFYGYDKILENIPEEELDIFVVALEQVDDNEYARLIVLNCINDWGLEK